MRDYFKLDDVDRATVGEVRKALAVIDDGSTASDAISEEETVEALRLLLQIVDDGYAA
jgi:hypothetical protein